MNASTKPCIACAEEIQTNAKLCRFCKTHQDDPKFAKSTRSSPIDIATALGLDNRLCIQCKKYVVENEHLDRCDVCRGVSSSGKLPAAVQLPAESSLGSSKSASSNNKILVWLGVTVVSILLIGAVANGAGNSSNSVEIVDGSGGGASGHWESKCSMVSSPRSDMSAMDALKAGLSTMVTTQQCTDVWVED